MAHRDAENYLKKGVKNIINYWNINRSIDINFVGAVWFDHIEPVFFFNVFFPEKDCYSMKFSRSATIFEMEN